MGEVVSDGVTNGAVVIGAGPAGSLTALLLARAGVRTLLVEKRVFPRHKVCGCCLAPTGQAVLERSGASGVFDGGVLVETLDVRHAVGRVRARVPGYRVVAREVMDERLVAMACDAGTSVRFGEGAHVERDGSVCVGEDTVRPRVVVCADGIGGRSLKEWDVFAWDVRAGSRVGVGGVIDAGDAARDAITMCVGDGGYCGVAPLADGRFVVAAAVDAGAVRERSAVGAVRGLLEGAGVRAAVGDDALTGVPALTRRRASVEAGGRVFVVGDGVGYVEPFTGEGMSWALAGAELVSAHAMAALDGRYVRGSWSRDVRRVLGRQTLGCRAVTGVLRRPGLTAACARVARWSPGLSSMIARRVVAA